MPNETETRTWNSPVAHLIADMLEDYSDELSMKDRGYIEYAQLALEIAYNTRQRDILKAKLAALNELTGEDNGTETK